MRFVGHSGVWYGCGFGFLFLLWFLSLKVLNARGVFKIELKWANSLPIMSVLDIIS